MLYQLFRFPLWLLFFSFYKRIYWANAQKVPKGVPIVIVSNHSTAFVEQMLVAAFLRRGVYFWARSSVFSKYAWVNKFYEIMHLLPITRGEDGLKDPKENEQTFQTSYRHILSGKALFVAPEGNCVMEKRLRLFRTGTARVALGAAASIDFEGPVAIVPVGVNYTHHRFFRSDVMISFGDPIWINDYQETFRKDPQRAAKQLTNAMKQAVREQIVSIDHPADEPLTEQLFELYRNESVQPIGPRFSRNNRRLRMEQRLANMVNTLEAGEKEQLASKSANYFNKLGQAGLVDAMLAPRQQLSFWGIIVLLIGFLPALLGTLFGYPPIAMARHYRQKWLHTPKSLQFWAPIGMIMTWVGWMAWGLLLIMTTAWWWRTWSLALPPVLVLLQYWSFCYRDYANTWKNSLSYRSLAIRQPELLATLQQQRKELKANVDGRWKNKNDLVGVEEES